MADLDTAITIATKAHAGQVDKAGKPYILHPLRLMLSFHNDIEMITAILHDVVEDSETSIKDLKAYGFSPQILSAIDCLSHKENEHYKDFIQRISTNELATKVKIADLKDNMNLTRLSTITPKDLSRIEKYHQALATLLNTEHSIT